MTEFTRLVASLFTYLLARLRNHWHVILRDAVEDAVRAGSASLSSRVT